MDEYALLRFQAGEVDCVTQFEEKMLNFLDDDADAAMGKDYLPCSDDDEEEHEDGDNDEEDAGDMFDDLDDEEDEEDVDNDGEMDSDVDFDEAGDDRSAFVIPERTVLIKRAKRMKGETIDISVGVLHTSDYRLVFLFG